MKRISFLFTVLLCMLLPVSVYAAAEAGMFDADARLHSYRNCTERNG